MVARVRASFRFAIFACVALQAASAGADDATTTAARRHFKAGVALLDDPEGQRFEEAYAEFKAAYELSKSPKILGNIGLCAMKLERDGEAIDAYEHYLKEVSDIDPEERAQVMRDLQTLTASAAHLTLTVSNPNATVLDTRVPVQGSSIRNTYPVPRGKLVLVVRPGQHVLTVKLGGKEREVWDVTATGGARLSHDFLLKDEPSSVGGSGPDVSRPVAPWILVGVGGAALVAGLVTGAITLGKLGNVADACPNDQCKTPAAKDELSSAKTFVTLTDTLIIGGAVVTAIGVGWLLLTPTKQPSSRTGRIGLWTF
jgi:hypothetical protein